MLPESSRTAPTVAAAPGHAGLHETAPSGFGFEPAMLAQRTRRLALPIILGFAAALLALTGVGVLGLQRVTAATSARHWVEHTHAVLDALAAVRTANDDGVTAARAYLLTGAPATQDTLPGLAARADMLVDDVARLTRDNRVQQARIPALRRLTTAHFDHLRGAAETATAGHDARALLASGALAAQDTAAALLATMRATERTLLAAREVREAGAAVRLREQVVLAVSGACLVCLAMLAVLWRDAGHRQRAERERDALFVRMQTAHEELEMQNEELFQQADELGEQSEQLARQSDELQGARDYLEALVAHLADGVIAFDEHGRVTVCNPAAQQLLGLPHGTVPLAEWTAYGEWRTADGRTPLAANDTPVAHVRGGGTVSGREVVLALAGGTPAARPRALLAAGRSVHDRAGQARGAILALHDITDRKAAERMKNELVSVVSHELRTPLTSIRGALGLLEAGAYGALPDAARRLVTLGRSNTDRLIRLVNDLLDLEQLQAGSLTVRREPVDVAALVATAVDGVRCVADERGVRLQTACTAPGHLTVQGDADRLTQVLTNLLSNAIKFSAAEGLVMVTVVQPAAGVVRVGVHDTGPGIAEHEVPRLFQRFQQLDASDARHHGGTGLGLAISKDLVEQHGGHIGVVSRAGDGACFWVELPCEAAPASPDAYDGEGEGDVWRPAAPNQWATDAARTDPAPTGPATR